MSIIQIKYNTNDYLNKGNQVIDYEVHIIQ